MSKKHILHIKIDVQMKKQLIKLAAETGIKSMSSQVVDILNRCSCLLDKRYFFGNEQESRYEWINTDTGIARVSLHVYLPEDTYRHLKLIHQDLNLYSIAQLIRAMLKVFLDFVNKHGENWLEQLKKWMKKTKRKRKSSRYCRKKGQLSSLNRGKAALITVYNTFFSPVHIYRC